MDAFELIIGQLLEEEKFWIRHCVKINLLPEEKRLIGKHSTPRPEIDIIAFDVRSNTIFLLEVKSYLDSPGVCYEDIVKEQEQQEGRYKILTSKNYGKVLSERLLRDWKEKGVINADTKVNFGLIAGKIYKNKESELGEYIKSKGWLFWGPTIIKKKMTALADKDYENNAVTIAAKLLLR